MTAEEVGRAGKLSDSNFGAPASRWKKEGKLFSILHDGLERFPAYALDESYRPLAAIATVMKRLGAIRGWRMAVWFESSNAWLDGDRPRVRIQSEPTAVIEAAQHYRNISHG